MIIALYTAPAWAFATLMRERADALFAAPDAFFISRRVQFVTLAALRNSHGP